jgi:protein-disulfide isomerase
MENEEKREGVKNTLKQNQIAGAIIIAGLLIAGAILLKGNGNTASEVLANVKIAKVSAEEHISGNPDAKIMIVEYSDTECPFSKRFHSTMHQVIKERGDNVAWVYRHFPIPQHRPKAFYEAMATECALAQSNNETYWKYLDEVYNRTQSNNKLDPAELPKIAESLGLNLEVFNSCLETEKYAEKVQANITDGENAGINGTPKGFILKKGKIVDTIDGAYPYEEVIKKLDKIK